MSNSAFETAFPKRHVLLQGHEYYRQERSRDENWALHLTYNEYQWLSWEIRCWKSKSFFFIGSAWQVLLHRLLSKVSKYKVSKIKIFWKEFSWNVYFVYKMPLQSKHYFGLFDWRILLGSLDFSKVKSRKMAWYKWSQFDRTQLVNIPKLENVVHSNKQRGTFVVKI